MNPNLRSEAWWNNPSNPGMTALYLERFLNYGITPGELQSGRPVIGIAQSANDPARLRTGDCGGCDPLGQPRQPPHHRQFFDVEQYPVIGRIPNQEKKSA